MCVCVCVLYCAGLVILGAGWASFKALQHIDTKAYDVVCISPRNYFVCTPLLCASAVGTLSFRSIVEPVRGLLESNVTYYEAAVEGIDFDAKTLSCRSNLEDKSEVFDVSYDKLVIGVGAKSNTFGIPGVEQHCMFLKDTSDSRRIRQRLIECFGTCTRAAAGSAGRGAMPGECATCSAAPYTC